jgi:predicted esterase
MRIRRTTGGATALLLVAMGLTATAGHAGSSPSRSTAAAESIGQRPGPGILYATPADAPQLQNRPGSGWRAAPLLVSGAAAYVRGEYLYQGYLFDDHGGAGVPDASDPILSKYLFAAKTGTLTYPTDTTIFANNVADLVEFRVRPTSNSTALRVTLNSLVDPRRTAFTVAIGSSASAVTWPAGAGVSSPAALFLTVHGDVATLTDAASGKVLAPAPSVYVDTVRKQYDVRIPHRAWNPGGTKVRFAAGVGLWDVAAGRYLVPSVSATTTTPGGASPSREALFDMAFRFHEPAPDWNTMGLSTTLVDGAAMEQADQHCFWRDCAQGAALRLGDVSSFFADIDFGALRRGITDTHDVPRTGSIDRIFASHFSFGQGVNAASACGRFPVTCHGEMIGNLQPYNVYVPAKRPPATGWGVTVQLHAAGGNYNEYIGSNNQIELGNRGRGSVVITALARDDGGDYTDASEADVFEAWADAARHYPLDPSRAVIAGYSMGGGGTYKLMERWPDLFARGFAAAAVPYDHGFQGQWLMSMRSVPLLVWISNGDEGSPILYQREQISALQAHGLRFTFDEFVEGDHVTLATNDEFGPAAQWLGDARIAPDPAHVTFAVAPPNDFPDVGVVADHDYWLSGLKVRSLAVNPDGSVTPANDQSSTVDPGTVTSGAAGLIDAFSYGFGAADPAVLPPGTVPGAGVLEGGHHGPMPYLETVESWAPARPAPVADRLDLTVANLSWVVVDLRRAHLTCGALIDVRSDGPVTISLPQCHATMSFGSGATARRIPTGPGS